MKRRVVITLLGLLGVVVLFVGAILIGGYISDKQNAAILANSNDQELFDAAVSVCNGGNVPNAAEYLDNGLMHPIVVMSRVVEDDVQGGYGRSGNLNRYWPAYSVAELQLVACIEDNRVLIRTCDFTQARKLFIKQHQNTIRIHVARTGEMLTSKLFEGDIPFASLKCPLSYSFPAEASSQIEYGSQAREDNYKAVIDPYANP